jgi:hypothetical protein
MEEERSLSLIPASLRELCNLPGDHRLITVANTRASAPNRAPLVLVQMVGPELTALQIAQADSNQTGGR